MSCWDWENGGVKEDEYKSFIYMFTLVQFWLVIVFLLMYRPMRFYLECCFGLAFGLNFSKTCTYFTLRKGSAILDVFKSVTDSLLPRGREQHWLDVFVVVTMIWIKIALSKILWHLESDLGHQNSSYISVATACNSDYEMRISLNFSNIWSLCRHQ